MKNFINKKIIFSVFSIILLTSCILDDNVTDFGNGPIVVQFPEKKLSKNFLQDESNKVYKFEVPVQYFGGDNTPLDKDVTLTVGVNKSKSTAEEGVEFNLKNTSFTIPAGSNSSKVTLEVNSANLDSSNPKVVALEILDSSEKASNNRGLILLTLQAICPSDLAGNWKYSNGRKSGRKVEIKETGSGTYSISADNYFGGDYSINISDVCGKITVTGGFLKQNFSIAVSGNGTVSDDGKTINMVYTADGYITDYSMTLERQ